MLRRRIHTQSSQISQKALHTFFNGLMQYKLLDQHFSDYISGSQDTEALQ